MADEKLLKAQTVYATLCGMLDKRGWKYDREDEKLTISCKARGEDLPMDIRMIVDVKRSLVMLLSHMPFVVPEDKRIDLAIAISVVNNRLIDGSFDYDIRDGHIFFRQTASYLDSEIADTALSYMLSCSCGTIDDYNDKFLMIGKGMLSLEKFMEEKN
ncbi:MAG: YbjN domain-containing protein [Acetatifactor sp.]|nr:YbjN domain-containing protein [Acetatifactor sp.]